MFWSDLLILRVLCSYADIATISGQLVSTTLVPIMGSIFGWRVAFIILGLSSALYTIVWIVYARSRPDQGGLHSAVDLDFLAVTDTISLPSAKNANNDPKNQSKNSSLPPLGFWLSLSVWAVILQNCCFNGTKYFFSAWMPTYFSSVFNNTPEKFAVYLGGADFLGILFSLMWGRVEQTVLKTPRPDSLLFSRRLFAGVGFGGAMVASALLAYLHYSGGSAVLTGVLLCVNSLCLTAHAFAYKPNYLDLTIQYQGILMGVGNMFATFMTYVVPLGAAHVIQKAESGDGWVTLFIGMSVLNLLGAVIGIKGTSITSLDAKFATKGTPKQD